MENIAISVIVPVYGVERYIERCARSIFGQTMTDGVEFIFVNDCTPDRSIDLLSHLIDEYPQISSRVKIIDHHRNRGLAAARQTGLDAARGEYILHLDSDDYFEPDMIEVMYQAALANNADVVVADFFWSFKERDVYQECPLYSSKETILKSIIAPWRYENKTIAPSVWNKLTRRSIYKDHNINPVEGINYGEDFLVVTRIIYHASVITKVDRAFVHYNKHNPGSYTQVQSTSNTRQRLKATEFVARFLSPHAPAYDEVFDEKRFREKLIGIAHCHRDNLQEFLSMYTWLDYEKHKHLVDPYWRIPYKYALQGKVGMFLFMRTLIFSIRKVYRSIYGF